MDPQKLIWIDTQGSLTHIVAIFKFGDVSEPRAKKWPKLNRQLKIACRGGCTDWEGGSDGCGGGCVLLLDLDTYFLPQYWQCVGLFFWWNMPIYQFSCIVLLKIFYFLLIWCIKYPRKCRFSIKKTFRVDLDPHILTVCGSDFFVEMANSPVFSLILPLNYIKMSFYF